MPEPPFLQGLALSKDFPSATRVLHALRGVDITINPGDVLGIVGESGCGKSTLARLLLGLLAPSSGDIFVHGRPIASLDRRAFARLIQPVFQDPAAALNPALRIGSIIRLPLDIHRSGRRRDRVEKVAALMQQVGLSPDLASRHPHELSGGQRQRVAIARALMARPQVLICDEPTSALDVSVQAQILNLLQDLQQQFGLGLVLISHNLAVIEHLAQRVMIMYLGRVVETGPTRTTLRAPRHPYTDRLRRAVLSPIAGIAVPADESDDLFPDPYAPPPGCAFHPRCPRRTDLCRMLDPPLRKLADGAVACHHPQEPALA